MSTVCRLIVSRAAFPYLAAVLTSVCRVNVSICCHGNQENLCPAGSGDQATEEQLMPRFYFPETKPWCVCVCYGFKFM